MVEVGGRGGVLGRGIDSERHIQHTSPMITDGRMKGSKPKALCT